MKATIAAVIVAACATSAAAQGPSTLVQTTTRQWNEVRDNITKAAEQMSEADYAFKPTDKVRSFGQLIAHIADANQGLCAGAIGDKSKSFGDAEKTKTTKADIVAALKASNAVCDAAFAKLDDKTALELIEGRKMPTVRISGLISNTSHDWEHYGNIVTYMRLKNQVPPSSQGGM